MSGTARCHKPRWNPQGIKDKHGRCNQPCFRIHSRQSKERKKQDYWNYGLSLRNHGFREVLKVLHKHGFAVQRQSGSHIQLAHVDGRYVTVPRQDPIKTGTLKSILFQAKISREQFMKQV